MDSKLTLVALCSDLYHLINPIPDQELFKEECKTYYTKIHMENLAWTVSLGLMSWTLHNFKKKAEDGHCHNTTHPHGEIVPRNCEIGREFHEELYKCLRSFMNLNTFDNYSTVPSESQKRYQYCPISNVKT